MKLTSKKPVLSKLKLGGILVTLGFFLTFEVSFFLSNIVKFFHGGYVAVIIAIVILFIMYLWYKSHIVKMQYREYVQIKDYKKQLGQLSKDPEIPKYASNLVCLSNCSDPWK